LRALTDLFGDSSKSDVPLEEVPKTEVRFRQLLHKWSAGSLLKWRWEQMEEVAEPIGEMHPMLKRNWNASWFGSDAEFVKRITAALTLPWVHPYVELLALLSK